MTAIDNNEFNPKPEIKFDHIRMTRAAYERLKQEQQAAEKSESKPINNQLLRDLRGFSESMHHEIFRLKCLCGLLGNQNENGGMGCTAEELSFTMDPIIERLEEIQQVFSDFSYRKYETLTKPEKQA